MPISIAIVLVCGAFFTVGAYEGTGDMGKTMRLFVFFTWPIALSWLLGVYLCKCMAALADDHTT
jgi:hypothetical protein